MILVPCGVAVVAGYISVWQSTMDTKFVHLSISPPSLRPTVDGGASRDEDTITGSGTPSRTSAAATRTVPLTHHSTDFRMKLFLMLMHLHRRALT